jgi:class 3 adenylate cyclase
VTAPTLVIQNLGDAYVRPGHARYLVEHITGARLLERESSDHWPLPEPDLLVAIERFITGSSGDGILATFDGPGRAVRCALAFSAAARQMGLPLRSGLHTGEIEVRGRDIGGIAVHAASRVMANSAPDEVLVSRVVSDLVAGAGLRFDQRGAHEFKGLPGRWDLFAASA